MREMKINKIAIGTIFALGLSLLASPAYAEDVAEEPAVEIVEESPAPAPEPEPAPEPAPEPSYTPPPEASEGVGGWAVVDPDTGNVHGVIVGTIDTYKWVEEQGGMGHEYMGCHAKCVLRFQTRAEESGNVVGVHSHDDIKVKWDGNDKNTFSYDQGPSDRRTTSTLVPEKTMLDGRSIDTGVINRKTESTLSGNVKIEQRQEDYLDKDVETDIFFPEWGEQGKLFRYLSQLEAERNLQTDIDSDLVSEGYTTEITTTETVVDEETGEETTTETTETVIDEENVFVKTVRVWTQSVVDFFRGIFS